MFCIILSFNHKGSEAAILYVAVDVHVSIALVMVQVRTGTTYSVWGVVIYVHMYRMHVYT